MKLDRQIQNDVIEELAFDPSIQSEQVGVSVKDGIVMLSGYVPSYGEKYAAERAAFRVAGVKAVAEDIEVKLPSSSLRTDLDIAKSALDALKWRSNIPTGLQVAVEHGRVSLGGEVDWEYQRQAATNAVRYLTGVTGVTNKISIKSKLQPDDVKSRIEKALIRSAEKDAQKIRVETLNGKVTLTGSVRSRAEFDDARWAAWAAPGVMSVENRLSVDL